MGQCAGGGPAELTGACAARVFLERRILRTAHANECRKLTRETRPLVPPDCRPVGPEVLHQFTSGNSLQIGTRRTRVGGIHTPAAARFAQSDIR